jgi:hypothetical protein
MSVLYVVSVPLLLLPANQKRTLARSGPDHETELFTVKRFCALTQNILVSSTSWPEHVGNSSTAYSTEIRDVVMLYLCISREKLTLIFNEPVRAYVSYTSTKGTRQGAGRPSDLRPHTQSEDFLFSLQLP